MTSLLQQRWRSRKLVGDARHVVIVRLRRGFMKAGYFAARRIDDGSTPFNGSPIFPPLIYQGNNINCFKKEWTPLSPWRELPNVVSVKWSQSFDPQTGGQKGATTATIVMDNIGFTDVTGVGGLYHKIDRGYFSPGRGEVTPPRAKLWRDAANEWKEVLNAGWQVEVWEGYGTGSDVQLRTTLDPLTNSYAPISGALSRTFTGVVIDMEQESHPDQITITVADFSVMLTDQRLAGWNKALEVPSPVTFADKKRAGSGKMKGWILVSDAAEVVRMLLIWAGFQEWHVENFGWSLFLQVVYGSDKHLIDIINDALQQADFIFFMGPPSNDDRSIGKPHFEYSNALDSPVAGALQVRDTDMTEALTLKWDLSNLPDIIRYQGAITDKGGATLLGYGIEGLTQRYRAAYYPPWATQRPVSRTFTGAFTPAGAGNAGIIYSAGGTGRDGSVNRQFTETMGTTFITQLNSDAECLLACVLAALNYALNMATVQFQIPGIAPLRLNDQIGVADEAAGVNSRIWVNSIDSEHVTGGGDAPGYWRMTVGGALMDTPDMAAIKRDYNYAKSRVKRAAA